ncbi:hypothetical protein HDU76_001956 [Blyttiomyces sp. JEL0837]|nr:hypothetical protein HDU76_001956 [Blyttiomyces sp. JEL0837]
MPVLKRFKNHLDKLSPELYSQIVDHTDALTRFLNNQIPEHTLGEYSVMVDIWCQAFKMDWQGDLKLLPFEGVPTIQNGLCFVHTKSMYHRLCELRPDLNRKDVLQAYFTNNTRRGFVSFNGDSWINGVLSNMDDDEYTRMDADGNRLFGQRDSIDSRSRQIINTLSTHLSNIPLRHGWLEELDPYITNADPILLADFAIFHGHFQLYKELVRRNDGQPWRRPEEERTYLFDAAARQRDEKLFEDLIAAGYVPQTLDFVGTAIMQRDWMLKNVFSPGHRGYFQYLCEHDDPNRLLEKVDGWMTPDIVIWEGFCELAIKCGKKSSLVVSVGSMLEARTVIQRKSFVTDEALDKMLTIVGAAGNDRVYQYLHQNIKMSKGTEWFQDMVECIRKRESWSKSQITYQSIAFLHKHSNSHCDPKWMTEFIIKDRSLVGVLAAFHDHCRCPGMFTANTMNLAAKYGCLNHVKFLHEHRNEGCTTDATDFAATNGHLEVVKFLHENRNEGCTTNALDGAAGKGLYDIVKWLHENRVEGCTTKAMDNAAKFGCLDVVRFLQNNRSEGCSLEGLKMALVWREWGSMLGMIAFLLDHYGDQFDLEEDVLQNLDRLHVRVRMFLLQWKSKQSNLSKLSTPLNS